MEMFLIVFYFIPRRYYLSGEEESINIDIREPLLDDNYEFLDQYVVID